MNTTSPALVTERGARRLPRLTLLLLCAVYVLPGLLGRDPWRGAELISYAQMLNMASGVSGWSTPALGGAPLADVSLLPIWLGASAISLLAPLLEASVAARLPFATLLLATMALTWYATFHLARTENAQPLPFAFGGEANPIAYARAIADGALLAFIATLGLLQLGHETTPEVLQLFGLSLFLYGMSAAPWLIWQPRLAIVAALTILSASGAAGMALALGIGGAAVCLRSAFARVRHFATWLVIAVLASALLASYLGAWHWRAKPFDTKLPTLLIRQWVWFLWPVWPLSAWTLWRWRSHLFHRHIAVPLLVLLVGLVANVAMGGADRALLLVLPATAILAAFALPTFSRGTSAAVDWFSMIFFTLWALTIWVIFVSVHTGTPSQPAFNVAKLAQGFVAEFDGVALTLAVLATLAWLALVRWRTGRHQEALWKSLALPAGGVALIWVLLMTLGLPLLDYARSQRPWLLNLAKYVPQGACIYAPDASATTLATLDISTKYVVQTNDNNHTASNCDYMLRVAKQAANQTPLAGWQWVADWRRPTDRDEMTSLFRRSAADRAN